MNAIRDALHQAHEEGEFGQWTYRALLMIVDVLERMLEKREDIAE